MEKEGNIVRYTDEEIKAMIARGEDRTDWARVMAKTEEELAADMASDPAWDGVPEDWVSRGHPASGPPGPLKENKRQVTMRFEAKVRHGFKKP